MRPVRINPETGKIDCLKCGSSTVIFASAGGIVKEHFFARLVQCLQCSHLYEQVVLATKKQLVEAHGEELGLKYYSQIPEKEQKE